MKTTKTIAAAVVLVPLMMVIGCGGSSIMQTVNKDLAAKAGSCLGEVVVTFPELDDEAKEDYEVHYRLFCDQDENFTKEEASIVVDYAGPDGTPLTGLEAGETYYCAVAVTEEIDNVESEESPLPKERLEVVVPSKVPSCGGGIVPGEEDDETKKVETVTEPGEMEPTDEQRADKTSPTVSRVYVVQGAKKTTEHVFIKVHFSEAISARDIDLSKITIAPTIVITKAVRRGSEGNILTLYTTVDTSNKSFNITFGAGFVQDLAGNASKPSASWKLKYN